MEIKKLDDKDVPDFTVGSEWSRDAAFSTDMDYLFFLTLDIPHEETLKVVLFNKTGTEVESIELSAPYTPGLFEYKAIDANKIRFGFWPEIELTLELINNPVWAWHARSIENAKHSGSLFKKRRLVIR